MGQAELDRDQDGRGQGADGPRVAPAGYERDRDGERDHRELEGTPPQIENGDVRPYWKPSVRCTNVPKSNGASTSAVVTPGDGGERDPPSTRRQRQERERGELRQSRQRDRHATRRGPGRREQGQQHQRRHERVVGARREHHQRERIGGPQVGEEQPEPGPASRRPSSAHSATHSTSNAAAASFAAGSEPTRRATGADHARVADGPRDGQGHLRRLRLPRLARSRPVSPLISETVGRVRVAGPGCEDAAVSGGRSAPQLRLIG